MGQLFFKLRQVATNVMKITHNVALNFHPIFILLNRLFGAILDFGFWIADLLYLFDLSFFINLIRRRTLNLKSMRNKSGITF